MPDIIELTLPDGQKLEVQKGSTALDAAKMIGAGLAKACVAAKLDGKMVDLSYKIEKNCKFELLKADGADGLNVMRHSASHVMAQAVLRLFHDAKLTIGPVIEDGFYYDFERKEPFTPADLEKIEHEMKKIIDEDQPFERKEVSKKEAMALYPDNVYKREVISELPEEEKISVYYNRKTEKSPQEAKEFFDLCMGPHLPSTGKVGAYKLLKVAGAYWRGDAKNAQLQRIYATAFSDKKKLAEYLKNIEEAEKRDHRKLGREMELFNFHEWSPGSPFILPKGTIIYNELVDYLREEYAKRGYKEVITPQLYHKGLWEQSGHWEHYQENMFILNVDEAEFAMKPMNCPSHMLLYNMTAHSYRDLPVRIADFCMLHRNELRGVLGGMTRVRKFSQDDAHIFLAQEQIGEEIDRLVDFIKFIFIDTFKFDFVAKLSTRPQKFMGEIRQWDEAEKLLEEALKRNKIPYVINAGEGAFYGPKIDFDVKDALGRGWQLSTIQIDYQIPARFKCEYEGADGQRHTCVVIHRALLGSIERFMGILIEHYAGKFPLWLAPVQVMLIPMAGEHKEFASKLKERFVSKGIRCAVDERDDTLGSRIRDAQIQKIPYMLVIGKKEMESGVLNVRQRDGKLFEMREEEFVERIKKIIADRKEME